ncbi:hypothetical protein [Pollutimonas nitritireducens]|uniref:hypothetical protein n=1 Tax=Pollutimonas nitritireducens TaxID=2045209 RepID=UPI001E56029E|nr:hypothetical protein [Pollutimonas nitritireducens]
MNALSQIVDMLEQGLVLDVTIEDLQFRAYVVVSEPDIDRVADFVPKEQFEEDGDVHVAAIDQKQQAREQIEDIVFNMSPGDAAVFLCANSQVYLTVLEELGQAAEPAD